MTSLLLHPSLVRLSSVVLFLGMMMFSLHFHHLSEKFWGDETAISLIGSFGHTASSNVPKTSPAPTSTEDDLPETRDHQLDLLNLTPEDFGVLRELVHNRNYFEAEKKKLDLEKQKLQVLERSIQGKIDLLKKLGKDLEKRITLNEKQAAKEWGAVVRMYEKMKPQEAAPIFLTLDIKIVLKIMGQMDRTKAGAILAHMPPEQAARLTASLAQQNETMKKLG